MYVAFVFKQQLFTVHTNDRLEMSLKYVFEIISKSEVVVRDSQGVIKSGSGRPYIDRCKISRVESQKHFLGDSDCQVSGTLHRVPRLLSQIILR